MTWQTLAAVVAFICGCIAIDALAHNDTIAATFAGAAAALAVTGPSRQPPPQ